MKTRKAAPATSVIHLLGLAGMFAVLLVGALIFAAPQITDAITTQQKQKTTEQSNEVLHLQLLSLQQAQNNMATIAQELEQLRIEIPTKEDLDEVFEEITLASIDTGANLMSITTQTPQEWLERTSEAARALIARINSGDPETPQTGTPTAPTPPAGAAAPGTKLSVTLNVTATAATLEAATDFIEALSNTSRMLSINTVAMTTSSDDEPISISVEVVTFVVAGDK